jgi:phosphatidylglycerol---prolipoprotein diacylglyceryl transferase
MSHHHHIDSVIQGPLPFISVGDLQIPTYFLIISFTACLAILWFYRRAEAHGLSVDTALNISFIILLSAFLGARLAHILFEAPAYYWQNPMAVFDLASGGYVFYGGALLAYLCAFMYVHHYRLPLGEWHDVLAPIAALSYMIGRFACFLAGCCYGKVCDWPWAWPTKQVDLISGMSETLLRHPTQLYAMGTEGLSLLFLLWWQKRRHYPGQVFLLWVLLHSLGRLVMESLRDDPRGPLLWAQLSISSWTSLILLTISLSLMWRWRSSANINKARKS